MLGDSSNVIGKNLFGFQASLVQSGSSPKEYLEKYYYQKWMSEALCAAMSVRTTFKKYMRLIP
jgi:hypothetical protein